MKLLFLVITLFLNGCVAYPYSYRYHPSATFYAPTGVYYDYYMRPHYVPYNNYSFPYYHEHHR